VSDNPQPTAFRPGCLLCPVLPPQLAVCWPSVLSLTLVPSPSSQCCRSPPSACPHTVLGPPMLPKHSCSLPESHFLPQMLLPKRLHPGCLYAHQTAGRSLVLWSLLLFVESTGMVSRASLSCQGLRSCEEGGRFSLGGTLRKLNIDPQAVHALGLSRPGWKEGSIHFWENRSLCPFGTVSLRCSLECFWLLHVCKGHSFLIRTQDIVPGKVTPPRNEVIPPPRQLGPGFQEPKSLVLTSP
jgi:hypothetical protein